LLKKICWAIMQQGQTIDLEITDLADSGDGVGRYENIAVFVPDSVPGDRLQVKLTFVKPKFAHASIKRIVTPSRDRVRPSCIVADKCGGCQWQVVSYKQQLRTKQNQVVQALKRIGGFDLDQINQTMQPILAAPDSLEYRNKSTFPLGVDPDGKVKAGYYQKGTHKLVNLNQCPVQDDRLNPLLAGIKADIQTCGWQIYDEVNHTGLLRHFSLRIGRHTGEILLTLISKERELPGLREQAELWLQKYPALVGILLNHNGDRTNAIFGSETHCVAGQDYLEERFAGLRFQLRSDTFFQVYTEQAEAMLLAIQAELDLQGTEILLDAYAGMGALTLPLAQHVKQAIAIESQHQATTQGTLNAQLNGISNATFHTGTVENILPGLDIQPDIVLLDPPRKGCHPDAIAHLLHLSPPRIVYVSCNPATLARDLKLLCANSAYHITRIQPIDFFPQTSHVETIVFLTKHQ
jgi:23S rRNA (uracil1939-C5)-methyltransferase